MANNHRVVTQAFTYQRCWPGRPRTCPGTAGCRTRVLPPGGSWTHDRPRSPRWGWDRPGSAPGRSRCCPPPSRGCWKALAPRRGKRGFLRWEERRHCYRRQLHKVVSFLISKNKMSGIFLWLLPPGHMSNCWLVCLWARFRKNTAGSWRVCVLSGALWKMCLLAWCTEETQSNAPTLMPFTSSE